MGLSNEIIFVALFVIAIVTIGTICFTVFLDELNTIEAEKLINISNETDEINSYPLGSEFNCSIRLPSNMRSYDCICKEVQDK